MEKTYDRLGEHQGELFQLLKRVTVIKTMLWVGDYDVARQEVEALSRAHERLIERASSVQKDIMSMRRTLRPRIGERYKKEGLKGWNLDYAIRLEIAKQTNPKDPERDSLFVIGPIVNLLNRLRVGLSSEEERAASIARSTQLGLPLPESGGATAPEQIVETDELSGFRFAKSARDEGSWEYRAYRIDPPVLIPERLLENLERILDARFERVALETETPGRAKEISWPLWVRAFAERAFLELVFFDSGRFLAQVITGQTIDEAKLFAGILAAVARTPDRL